MTKTIQITNNGEHSETSEETKGAVSDGDNESVLNDGLVTRVVGGIRCHDTHANTKGEEDLCASISPDRGVSEDFTNNRGLTGKWVFTLQVHSNTSGSVGEGKTLQHKEEDEENGERNSEVNNI